MLINTEEIWYIYRSQFWLNICKLIRTPRFHIGLQNYTSYGRFDIYDRHISPNKWIPFITKIAHCHLCCRAIGQPSNYLDRIDRLIWQLNRPLFEGLSYSSYTFIRCSSLFTLWFIEMRFSSQAERFSIKEWKCARESRPHYCQYSSHR